MFCGSGWSVALPTEARQLGNNNRLPSGLGKAIPIESRGVSRGCPKRSGGPPERKCPAALAGANGAKYSFDCDKHIRTGGRSVQAFLRPSGLARVVRHIGRHYPEAIAVFKDEVASSPRLLVGRIKWSPL